MRKLTIWSVAFGMTLSMSGQQPVPTLLDDPKAWTPAQRPECDPRLECGDGPDALRYWSVNAAQGDSPVQASPGASPMSGELHELPAAIAARQDQFRTVVDPSRGARRTTVNAAGFQIKDGWIAVVKRGEFGVGVFWFDPGGRRSRLLLRDDYRFHLVSSRGLWIFTGLEHGTHERGHAIFLAGARGAGGGRIFDLGGSPHAATIDSDNYEDAAYVATTTGVRKLSTADYLPFRILSFHCGELEPVSITRTGGTVYVGYGGWIARVPIQSDNWPPEQWWHQADCRLPKSQ